MKQALVILALVGLAFSAPQPRKLFHEHFDDFMEIIIEEAGEEIEHIMEHYQEFDEFWKALDYVRTNNFKELVYEMEALPEFVAVVDFLENDNIDIHYFLDLFNNLLESGERMKMTRHELSGRDFSAFIRDSIAIFPKDKLAALFDQKIAEDEEFRTAIENLQSDEWEATFGALWENEVFKAEVQALADNGIEIEVFLEEIIAIFVVLALVGLAFSAPQPRKLFHEHVEDFLEIIVDEAASELEHLLEHYIEYDEFWQALDYMRTNNFKNLIYEMESLPEFMAVVNFLENDNIDIHYFIDLFNELIENVDRMKIVRHETSGRNLTSFIKDSIEVFPKDKLSALFNQKMSSDEEFRIGIENLQSAEWHATFSALWASEVFQVEVKVLAENGIDIGVFLDEILAIFGQN